MRELGGKTGSAARAGAPASVAANAAKTTAKTAWRMRENPQNRPARPTMPPTWGGNAAIQPGGVTRRSVRLIRPPSGSSVEVPGMIRSTP